MASPDIKSFKHAYIGTNDNIGLKPLLEDTRRHTKTIILKVGFLRIFSFRLDLPWLRYLPISANNVIFMAF